MGDGVETWTLPLLIITAFVPVVTCPAVLPTVAEENELEDSPAAARVVEALEVVRAVVVVLVCFVVVPPELELITLPEEEVQSLQSS